MNYLKDKVDRQLQEQYESTLIDNELCSSIDISILADASSGSRLNYQSWYRYFTNVGAALSIASCNIDSSSISSYHYTEAISESIDQITVNNQLVNIPMLEDDFEHEIMLESIPIEDSAPLPPRNVIKVKGRVVKISKGNIFNP